MHVMSCLKSVFVGHNTPATRTHTHPCHCVASVALLWRDTLIGGRQLSFVFAACFNVVDGDYLLMGVLAQEAERQRVAAAEAEKKRLAEERVRL